MLKCLSKTGSGVATGDNTTFTISFNDDVYWYQTDYDGKSNKWIPAGIDNDSNKTVTVYGYTGNSINGDYEVTPNNAMFLNCYWANLKYELLT